MFCHQTDGPILGGLISRRTHNQDFTVSANKFYQKLSISFFKLNIEEHLKGCVEKSPK